MRISINKPAGFTLIELAAVIFILSLALGLGLALGGSGRRGELRGAAGEFTARAAAAADEAVLAGQPWGVDFFTGAGTVHYRWVRLEEAGWRAAVPPGRDSQANETGFPAGTRAALSVDGQALSIEARRNPADAAGQPAFAPELIFSPSREATPFTLTLRGADASDYTLVLSGDLLGRIEREARQ